jgi:hypothetical protein
MAVSGYFFRGERSVSWTCARREGKQKKGYFIFDGALYFDVSRVVGTGRLGSAVKLEMTHIFQAHGPAVGCRNPYRCEAVESTEGES